MPISTLGLRTLPLLASTATVTFAVSEVLFFSHLLTPSVPAIAISKWWDASLYPSLAWIFTLVGGSSISGLIASESPRVNNSSSARKLYRWGALLAVAHFTFALTIAKVIEKMARGPEAEVKDNQRKWLRIHAVRTLLTDIPALVCYGLAFWKSTE